MAAASTEAVSIAHYSPGRLRIKASALRRNETLAERIREALTALPGVAAVTVRPMTGSLLIEFSAEQLRSPQDSRRLVSALAELFPDAFDDDCISVHIAGLEGRDKIALQLRDKLARVPAVRSVAIDHGEIRVEYDPETLSIPIILDSLAS